MNEEKKNKLISSSVTAACMAALFILLLFTGLKYQYPPPAPKKVIMIELTSGGGGGGGNQAPNAASKDRPSADNYQTQNAQDAPAVASSPVKTENQQTSTPQPQVNPNATYKPGNRGGSGGGTGSGIGSGTGSGIGEGTGSGFGGGVGYGTGNRSFTYMPDQTVNEAGVVYVEVHINTKGVVIDARILNSNKYPTSISNSTILNQCVAKAKTARYKEGKEELRIIVFK